MKFAILIVMAAVTILALGCSEANSKVYDISSIFPLSADKCARYNGDEVEERGRTRCLVTKDECERAAADWSRSMSESGVRDALQFRCN
jgi:hypothetical protein